MCFNFPLLPLLVIYLTPASFIPGRLLVTRSGRKIKGRGPRVGDYFPEILILLGIYLKSWSV